MFSYDYKMLQSIFSENTEGAVAMARCNCTACNSCSCGRCYGDDCISQCTGCRGVVFNSTAWDNI